MIDTNAENYLVFMDELFRYLKILTNYNMQSLLVTGVALVTYLQKKIFS
jgi:hypothetical protein